MRTITDWSTNISESSVAEVIEKTVKHIEGDNKRINALISFHPKLHQQVRGLSELSQAQRKNKPLFGIPVLIKDNICVAETRTTAGSRMLQEFTPPFSATLVQRLSAAGAIILGKSNLDEFAMGSSSETSIAGPCRNPVDPNFVTGGSSGGSAAAVSAGWVPLAIGTDTGGSIRQPSSFCGVVGFKPTYGRISRYGLIAFASSLDQAGPMTICVEDAYKSFQIMSGYDENDLTTSDTLVPSENLQAANLKNQTIAVIKEFEENDWDEEVKVSYQAMLDVLQKNGANIKRVSVPSLKASVPVYYIVSSCEASSNLSRFDGLKYGYRYKNPDGKILDLEDVYTLTRGHGFGLEVKRRILTGTFALASGYYEAYYLQAAKLRRVMQQEFQAVLDNCDAILSPVSASLPFRLGEKVNDPLKMYASDEFTTWVNLCGFPGISLPWRKAKNGLPIGMQLVAAPFKDKELFELALSVEKLAE